MRAFLEEYGIQLGLLCIPLVLLCYIWFTGYSTFSVDEDVSYLEVVEEYPVPLMKIDGVYLTYYQAQDYYKLYINGVNKVVLTDNVVVEITEGDVVLDISEDSLGNITYIVYVTEDGISIK